MADPVQDALDCITCTVKTKQGVAATQVVIDRLAELERENESLKRALDQEYQR